MPAPVEAAPEVAAAEEVSAQAAGLEISEPAVPVEAAAAAPLRELDEFDISGEWEAVAASQVAVTEVAPEAVLPEMGPPEVARPAFDFEEAAAEIDFYVNHGLVEGARKVVARLEEKFPGDPQVAELRHLPPTQLRTSPRIWRQAGRGWRAAHLRSRLLLACRLLR